MSLLGGLDMAGQVSVLLLATVVLVLAVLIPALLKQAPNADQSD